MGRHARNVKSPRRLAVFARDGYRCRWCGAQAEVEPPFRVLQRPLGHLLPIPGKIILTVDHIRPLAMGGSNSMENLMTLCDPCNQRKGLWPYAEPPSGWLAA